MPTTVAAPRFFRLSKPSSRCARILLAAALVALLVPAAAHGQVPGTRTVSTHRSVSGSNPKIIEGAPPVPTPTPTSTATPVPTPTPTATATPVVPTPTPPVSGNGTIVPMLTPPALLLFGLAIAFVAILLLKSR